MTDRRPDVFEMPRDPEAARLVSLVRAIVGCPGAQGQHCFTDAGPIGRVVAFLQEVDFGARRRLTLSAGDRATADELALVNLIVEAQGGDPFACRARAAWLVRRGRIEQVVAAASVAADALALAGVQFDSRAGEKISRATEGEAGEAAPQVRRQG